MTNHRDFTRHFFLLFFAVAQLIFARYSFGDFMVARGVQATVNKAALNSAAQEAIESAFKAIQNREVEAARKLLTSLEMSPNVVHPEVLLAELLATAGFNNDCKSVLEEFSTRQPGRVDVYLLFTEIAVKQQRWFDGWNLASIGLRAAVPKHWSPDFKKQVRQRLLLLQATCNEGRKDWAGAKKIYAAMEPATIYDIDVLAGIGRTNFHLGEIEAALGSFEKIKSKNPESDSPYLLLAQLYDQTGKSAEAEEAYKTAYKNGEGEDKVKARLAYARWLILQNQANKISKLLQEPIEQSPDNERERQFLQALTSRMEGDYSKAQEILDALNHQHPDNLPISNQLALVLCESKDESSRSKAVQIAENNVRSQSKSSEAWATLGWVKFRFGDLKAAESSLANASQLGPLKRDGVYYALQLKRAAGDDKAVAILEKALEQASGPDYFTKHNAAK